MRLTAPRPATSRSNFFSSVGWGLLYLQTRLPAPRVGGLGLEDAPSLKDDAPPLNVLCMDGGGIKGRNLMAIIEEIEAATGQPAADTFDLVAGTSIGGCGALFLSKYAANATAMARAAMHELQYRCFSDRSVRRLLRHGHVCSDAAPNSRRQFTLDICGASDGEQALFGGDGPPGFALATRRTRMKLSPFLFRTYRVEDVEGGDVEYGPGLAGTSDATMWQAVEATSAAPFMFPRSRLRLPPCCPAPLALVLADGGCTANDPTLLALAEARRVYPGRRVGLVVSLGTGVVGGAPKAKAAARGERQNEARHQRRVRAGVREAAPGAAYFRLQPRLHAPISPIETDEAKLRRMEEVTLAQLREGASTGAVGSHVRGRQLIEHLRRQPRAGSGTSHQLYRAS